MLWKLGGRLAVAAMLFTASLAVARAEDENCGALGQAPCEGKTSCRAAGPPLSSYSNFEICNEPPPPCHPGLYVHDGKCALRSRPATAPLPSITQSVETYSVLLTDGGLNDAPLRHTFKATFVRNGKKLRVLTLDASQLPMTLRLLPGPGKPPPPLPISVEVYLENDDVGLRINRRNIQEKPEIITIARDLDPALFDHRFSILTAEDDRYQGIGQGLTSFMWEWLNRSADIFNAIRGDIANRKIEVYFVPSKKAPSAYVESDVTLKPNGKPLIRFYKDFNLSSITPAMVAHEYGHKVMGDAYGDFFFSYSRLCQTMHLPTYKIDQTCAFIEGWADFFALLVTGDPTFRYGSGKAFNYAADWATSPRVGELEDMNGPGDKSKKQQELNAALRAHPNDPALEGFVAHVLWKFYKDAGIEPSLFLRALANMKTSRSKSTLFIFTKALFDIASAEQRQRMRTLTDGWASGFGIGNKDELRRSAPPPAALESFEHVGSFYSSDNFLYDDARSDKKGSLEACADWCLSADQCRNFTYSYYDPATDRGTCTLYGDGIPRYQTPNDYELYHRLQ